MSETYYVNITCKNCKKINKLTIPRGTTIGDFLKDHKCFNCGCELEEKYDE